MSIRVEIKDGRAYVYTPYNKAFVCSIKNIGGARWTGSAWSIPEGDLSVARSIMEEIYGESDIPSTDPKVKIRVTVKEGLFSEKDDLRLFGKVLAHATSRDSGAWPGTDVTYEKEKPYSGGSAKYWGAGVPEGAVITIANVSKKNLERDRDSQSYDVEVLAADNARRELEKEKERLLKRLAEIEKMLCVDHAPEKD